MAQFEFSSVPEFENFSDSDDVVRVILNGLKMLQSLPTSHHWLRPM